MHNRLAKISKSQFIFVSLWTPGVERFTSPGVHMRGCASPDIAMFHVEQMERGSAHFPLFTFAL